MSQEKSDTSGSGSARYRPLRHVVASLSLVAGATLFPAWGGAQTLRDKVLVEGKADYLENCTACHGADATGKGELAAKLVKPPRDLTVISKSNGGTFPFWRVFAIIAGDSEVEGHDTHQMPDFASRMSAYERKPGYQDAHVRVLELTHYLQEIQR